MTTPDSTQNFPTRSPDPSLTTAAGAIGRFTARNPQFGQLGQIRWEPSPQGWVTVHIAHMHPDAERLIGEIGTALGLPVQVQPYTSTRHGAVRCLSLFGVVDGAEWVVETLAPLSAPASSAVAA